MIPRVTFGFSEELRERDNLRIEIDNARARIDQLIKSRPDLSAATLGALKATAGSLQHLAEETSGGREVNLAAVASLLSIADATASEAEHEESASETQRSQLQSLTQVADEVRRSNTVLFERLFKKRELDPYLHFTSAADKAAYEAREAAREQQIRQAQAEGTPASELRVDALYLSQLADAKAHGAEGSSAFAGMWQTATANYDKLAVTMRQAGEDGGIEPARDIVAHSAVDYLKSKGFTDQQIRSEETHHSSLWDFFKLERPSAAPAELQASPSAPPTIDSPGRFDEVASAIRAAGVTLADNVNDGHGLAVSKPARTAGVSVG